MTSAGPERSPRPPEAPKATPGPLRIHYHNPHTAPIYGALHLWCWGGDLKAVDLRSAGVDDFGALFEIPLTLLGTVGRPGLPPLGFRMKDRAGLDGALWHGPDHSWTRAQGLDVYIVEGDPTLHPSVELARLPRVVAAFLDTPTELQIHLDRAVPGLGDLDHFRLDPPATIHRVEVESEREVHLQTAPLKLSEGHTLKIQTPQGEISAGIMPRGVFEGLVPQGRLGVWLDQGRTHVALFAPRAKAVTLHLYRAPTGPAEVSHALRPGANGVWALALKGAYAGRYYDFTVDGPEGPGEHFDSRSTVNDPYADVALSSLGERAGRGLIVDWETLRPTALAKRPPLEALVIYECHVRGLTQGPGSGLSPRDPRRGRYLGAAAAGLRTPEGLTAGLDHLEELGVNAVQLLPVQEFPWERDRFNWGYFTANFFSPAGVYASQEAGDARVHELKALVDACHARGIAVILDVVFNHTAEGSQEGPVQNLKGIDGKYYYRQDPGSFYYYNGSGVGNELATEQPAARRLVVDCCRHWVERFGIDGFRFDLMALLDLDTLAALDAALPEGIYLYGEPWAASRARWGRGALNGLGRWAVFNDTYRDALKGDPEGAELGFIQGAGNREAAMTAVSGNTWDFGIGEAWANAPVDGIQYLTCHDNLTLFDKLQVCLGDGEPGGPAEAALRARMRLAYTLLLTSLGPLLLHGGVEMLRTKPYLPGNDGRAVPIRGSTRKVDANTYQAPDAVSALDWRRKARYLKEFYYLKGLIALRRAPEGAPLIRRETPGPDALRFVVDPRNPCALAYIHGSAGGRQVAVALNASGEHPAHFPALFPEAQSWRCVADGQRVDLTGIPFLGDYDGGVTLPPLGQVVLIAG